MGRVVKLADGSYQVLKLSSKEAEAFINQINKLNLDADALKLLNQDLNNKAVVEIRATLMLSPFVLLAFSFTKIKYPMGYSTHVHTYMPKTYF